MYLSEDYLTKWVLKNNGLTITRTSNNLKTFNFSLNYPSLAIITGYNNIVNTFFSEIINKFKNKVILIVIESDIINIKKEWLDNNKLIHCYSWNITINHDKLTPIPIALNFKRHYGSIITWLSNNKTNEKTIHFPEKMVCFNCNLNTSKDRLILKNVIDNNMSEFCDKLPYVQQIKTEFIPSEIEGRIKVDITDPKCYNEWVNYKFILSPEGAGIDCHRTWEALMIGCIPIVKSSGINELYNDLPVIVVNSWNDLNKTFLNNKYNEIIENKKNNKYNYNKLYLNYWCDLIQSKLDNLIYNIEKPLLLKQNKIHFITYGDNKYELAKTRLLKQAENFNIFDTLTSYSNNDLTSQFSNNFKDILSMNRGGGYWIWKLDIIKQTIDKIKDNDFIVYFDAGCHINKYGIYRFYDYINMFNNTDYGILSFQMHNQLEKWWTTKHIFEYFNINNDSNIKETGQYISTVLILRKNAHLLKYLELFEKCINDNKLLITDHYNNIAQQSYFKDNRHDQSISSIIRKKIGSLIINTDESFITPFGIGESLNYPIWAKRSRN